jgi:hypothetical protein
MWHHVYTWRYKFLLFATRHGALARLIVLFAAIGASILAIPALEHVLERHFMSEAGLSALRTLLVTLGGALIGATAIAFSVVIFAVQINFARMPHGLFSKAQFGFSPSWRVCLDIHFGNRSGEPISCAKCIVVSCRFTDGNLVNDPHSYPVFVWLPPCARSDQSDGTTSFD